MEKPVYYVHTQRQPEVFAVTHLRPEGAPAPKTEGHLRYTPGVGLELTMHCWETEPKAVFLRPDDTVCKDSCMEMFLNCFPELPEYGYINVEMNAAGIMRCGFGTDRHNRFLLLSKGIAQPEVVASKGDGFWQVQCLLTERLLETLYQRPCRFATGHEMQGNFYKCGDETASPHWASWSKVERLDFHTPEFFGILRID